MMMQGLLLKSYLLIKGDGNYGWHDGQFVVKRYPPPEAFNPEGEMDAPAFAHTGAAHEGETGIPGVGRLKVNPNRPSVGEHGELVFHDEQAGEHLHGIDGVIRAVGHAFAEQGINAPAMDVVAKAIQLHNETSPDQLPGPDSPDWRRIVMSDFQRGDHKTRSNFAPDGRLITTTPNGHHNLDNSKPVHRFGKFLEAYAVPFHKQLGEVMESMGYQNAKDLDFVKYPYVRPGRLNYLVNPRSGELMSAAYHMDMGHLRGGNAVPSHHLERFKDLGISEQAYRGISSYDVNHHLPLTYFLPQTTNRGRTQTMQSTAAHLNHMMGFDTSGIGTTIQQTRRPTDFKGSFNGIPLSVWLSSPEKIGQLAQELSKYPGVTSLFGETRMPTAKSKGTVSGQLHDAFSKELFGHLDEGIEPYLLHSERTPDVYSPYEGKGNRLSYNHSAKKIWAKAVASGNSDEGDSNFRHAALTPDVITDYGINIDNSPEAHANAEAIRDAVNEIAHGYSISSGSEYPKRVLPTDEEIQNLAPLVQTQLVGGAQIGDDPAQMDAPDYMSPHYVARGDAAPSPAAVADAAMASAGAPPAATPPPAPAPAPAPAAGGPAPVTAEMAHTQGRVGVRPTYPMSERLNMTPFQQQRAAFADAPMDEVRSVMEQMGRRIPDDPREADRSMRQFQSVMGDPYQQFITQYMKSADNPEAAKDRLIKAIEQLQLEDARKEVAVKKSLNRESIEDVRTMAKEMELAPIAVHTILSTRGDWERITKTYGYSDETVKKVKVTFGGI